MGTLILGGWIVVGLMVAGFERRPSDADPKFVTQLCVVGAIAGGFAGQVLRWYVFGEPLGFVFAAAGAELLLRSYRRRTPAPGSPHIAASAPPLAMHAVETPPVTSRAGSPALRGVEAFGWGVMSGCIFAGTAIVANTAAERAYALAEPHTMSLLIYVPLGLIIGFVVGVVACLRQPRRTTSEMLVFVAVAAFLWGSIIMTLGKLDAGYEHGSYRR